jgi:hypothetical protein
MLTSEKGKIDNGIHPVKRLRWYSLGTESFARERAFECVQLLEA